MPKTFFKRLPKFAFIGQKSTKLSAKNRFFPTLSAVMRFWEILLLEKSWAKAHMLSNIFKKFSVKTTFKLKINLIRKNLNFSSFQPNHQ
jgi:hypothetical protein